MQDVSMSRIITHWTMGNYTSNHVDRRAYHILVEGNGNVIRGDRKISDNTSTADGVYARHTKGANRKSIGVSCCAMVGSKEKPFKPGSQPLLKNQYNIMAKVSAELCYFYNIPVGRKTVLGHHEVQETLGVKQNGKWDPGILPWDLQMEPNDIGEHFRGMVQSRLEELIQERGEPILSDRFDSETDILEDHTQLRYDIRYKNQSLGRGILEETSIIMNASDLSDAFDITYQIQEGDELSIEIKDEISSQRIFAERRDNSILVDALQFIPDLQVESINDNDGTITLNHVSK